MHRPRDLVQPPGLDAATGDYLRGPMTPADFLESDRSSEIEASLLAELRGRHESYHRDHLGLVDDIDPGDLAESGWGVIVPPQLDAAVRDALQPLLDHRREQTRKKRRERFKELTYNGESKLRFLAANGSGPGAVDPRHIPYYLLIVGSPSEIPFRFQFDLGVNHAVGRLHFDRPEDYAHYVRGVIAAENERVLPRRARLLGVCNDDDAVTEQMHDRLVVPLSRSLRHRFGSDRTWDGEKKWDVSKIAEESTKKLHLCDLLRGAPSLLFAAAHGVSFPPGHPRQRDDQGALVCRDWPGPRKAPGRLSPEWYLAGRDVPDDARLGGLIAFLFACSSAGTPELSDFAHRDGGDPRRLSPSPSVAALPQRLLSHPEGSALAVVGHVDQLWSYSFYWPLAGEQLQVFEESLGRLMKGGRLGYAMEPFSQRYADLATELTGHPRPGESSDEPDFLRWAALRTALLDARNYVIVGDPAVRFVL